MKKFEVGAKFKGNVNGTEMQITAIKNGIATVKDLKTNKAFTYGLQALEHCNVTILA